MFGLPELDDIICLQLTQHDLARCARVNRKWHTIVVPYLWEDLSGLDSSSDAQRQAFRALVYEDYLHGQYHKLREGGHGVDYLERPHPSLPSFNLAKYSPWIKILPDLEDLLRPLHNTALIQQPLTEKDMELNKKERGSTELDDGPTGKMLLLHLILRCHTAKLSHHCLHYDSDHLDYAITESILPRVRHLSVRAGYHPDIGQLHRLQGLLDQCSAALEKLTFEINFHYNDVWDLEDQYSDIVPNEEGENLESTEPKEWSSLKELVLCLRDCVDAPQPHKFWSWVYRRCGRVESLEVSKIRRGPEVTIAEAALTHMPNLVHITLGQDYLDDTSMCTFQDDQVATLLGGSRKGWKTVKLKNSSRFQDQSTEVLERHFHTLEVFQTNVCLDLKGDDLVRVLRSCPNLHTFIDTDDIFYFGDIHDRVDYTEFIDRDPDTGLPWIWACELSLKVLYIQVANIPRPDLDRLWGIEERYPGQGQEIQGMVYDRLARLTNLEVLWLGHRSYKADEVEKYCMQDQSFCLEMSLKSGLYKLAELKKLKELSVSGMVTRIGVEEVQWMVEHWPRLRVIYGLKEGGEGAEAAEWLRRHCPEIQLLEL